MSTGPRTAWSIQRKVRLIALIYVLSVLGNLIATSVGAITYLRPAFTRAAVASELREWMERTRGDVRGLAGEYMRASLTHAQIQSELGLIVNELESTAQAGMNSSAGEHLDDLQQILAAALPDEPALAAVRFANIDNLFSQADNDLEIDRRTRLERTSRVQQRMITVTVLNSSFGVVLLLIGLHSVYRWLIQPVHQLRLATEKIARGDFDVRIELPYGDEMAALGTRIEHMAASIYEMQTRLLDRERWVVATETVVEVHEAIKSQLVHIGELVKNCMQAETGHPDIVPCLDRMLQTLQKLEAWLLDLQRSLAPDTPVLDTVHVKDLFESVRRAMQPALERYRVTLDVHIDTTLPPMNLDRVQFEHTLIALVSNAVEASRAGQGVSLEARWHEGCQEACAFAVNDTGHGMSANVMEKLFTPFFTTKSDGNGIGLNLARSVVEAHGGRILCQSDPGHGTRFTLVIPVRSADHSGSSPR